MNIDLREKNLSEYKDSFGFHYSSILAYLSTCFNDSIIVDLGTLYGNSAAALAYNKSNKVYTYDIESREEATSKFKLEEFKNVEYIITNCIEDKWRRQTDRDIILSSELIFLDVDPHDGVQEQVVLRFLVENDWKGIMVCDDTGAPENASGVSWIDEFRAPQFATKPMRDWWNSIDLPKFDIVNKYSSPTGTGIICFDNQKVVSPLLSQEEIEYKRNQFRFNPETWVHGAQHRDIERFDDGTFKTNDGITGTWGILNKNSGERVLLVTTWAGSLEIPTTKNES